MKSSEYRKVSPENRISLPSEYLKAHNIQPGDMVEVSMNSTYIMIEKFYEKNVCVVTGKLSQKGQMIGEAFISDEGMKLVQRELRRLQRYERE